MSGESDLQTVHIHLTLVWPYVQYFYNTQQMAKSIFATKTAKFSVVQPVKFDIY